MVVFYKVKRLSWLIRRREIGEKRTKDKHITKMTREEESAKKYEKTILHRRIKKE